MKKHSISSFSSLLLFFVFVLFLLPVLILSAGVYQSSVDGKQLNDNLYTASTYLTTKFRQHDGAEGEISQTELEGVPALCFTDEISGQTFYTYLYLLEGELKELFTMEDSAAALRMGTTIAELSSFSVEEPGRDMFHITLVDENGQKSEILLHVGSSMEGGGKS